MESEQVDCKLMTEEQREAFVYSLDIIRVALENGWGIKIFQRDLNLAYFKSILLDIGVDSDAFFNLGKFVEEKKPKSAYEWAREVQKNVFSTYITNEEKDIWFPQALEILDRAYSQEINPWEVLTKEQFVNVNTRCKELIDYVYSLE